MTLALQHTDTPLDPEDVLGLAAHRHPTVAMLAAQRCWASGLGAELHRRGLA